MAREAPHDFAETHVVPSQIAAGVHVSAPVVGHHCGGRRRVWGLEGGAVAAVASFSSWRGVDLFRCDLSITSSALVYPLCSA